jgi:SSS family transporter
MLKTALTGLAAAIAVVMLLLAWLGFTPRQMLAMVSRPAAGSLAQAPGEAQPTTFASTVPPRHARSGLETLDYGVIALYLCGMLVVGGWAGRGVKSARSLFLAGERMNYVLVGISLLGAYLSALTMMGLPGMAYGRHDWTYMVQLPWLVLTGAVIVGWILPRYRAAGVVSIYEYLERRQHVAVRLLASTSFLVFAVGRLGLVLYLPSLAFHTVTGFPLAWCIVIAGVAVTVYTALGGLKAAIWTDLAQVLIFIGGSLLMLHSIIGEIGPARFVDIGLACNKFRLLALDPDVRQITTWWLILETIYQTIRIYGTQQDMAQLYLSTASTARAARSVWMSVLLYIPLGFLFYFLGTAFFAFYQVFPDPALPPKPDQILPYFAVHHLPAGVAGLVLAAIFAAAMSSIDACMNAASTVCVEDFARRFSRRARPDRFYLRLARGLILFWGALMIAAGLLFMKVQYAQIMWGKVMGVCTNGVLGLMLLAFLPFRVDWRASVFGFALGYLSLALAVRGEINFLLWPVIGNTVCLVSALLAHALLKAATKPPAPPERDIALRPGRDGATIPP